MSKSYFTESGKELQIIKELGSGGQGTVYKVAVNGQPKALKLYKCNFENRDEFINNLKNNIRKGAPNASFLWPEDFIEIENQFGYIMGLRPQGYHELSEFILGRNVQFKSFKSSVDTAIKIVQAFQVLHSNGFCYQDLNDGNFFINPDTGDVLICDNDNVAPNNGKTFIVGKPRYMAPEVVLGGQPNTQSDRFSLCVILFLLLCHNHPLEGKRWVEYSCMTPQIQTDLYGKTPIFIFDPTNNYNAAVPGYQDNAIMLWKYLPQYVKDAFIQSFSNTALHDPNKRLREIDWVRILTRFRDNIARCSCGNEVFIENESDTKCDSCHTVYKVNHRLVLPYYKLPIIAGSYIYRIQVEALPSAKECEVLLRIVRNKASNELYIQNLTGKSINVITPSGKNKEVLDQGIIPIKPNLQIQVLKNCKALVIE